MLEQILDSVGPLDIIQYFQQTKNVMVLLLWRASLSQAQVRRKEGSSSENQESLKSFKVFLLPLPQTSTKEFDDRNVNKALLLAGVSP